MHSICINIIISCVGSLFLVNTKKARLLPGFLECLVGLIPVCQVAASNYVKSNT